MKPGPHVVELRDADGNLKRKAVGPVGCLEAIEKAGQVWLGRALPYPQVPFGERGPSALVCGGGDGRDRVERIGEQGYIIYC